MTKSESLPKNVQKKILNQGLTLSQVSEIQPGGFIDSTTISDEHFNVLFIVHVCTCLCTHATVPLWRMTWGNQFILFLPCGSLVFSSAVRAGDKHHFWVNHIAGPKQALLINCLATRKHTRSKKMMSKVTSGKPGFLQPFHNRLTFFSRAFSVPENELP